MDDFSSDISSWDILVGKVIGRWDHANLKIAPHEASPNRFQSGSILCLQEKSGERKLITLLSSRKQGKAWVCDCGILGKEDADACIGATLWIHRSMRPRLPEGEFYLDEIIGLRVKLENGEDLGQVEEILESPAHNIYVTVSAMIPAHSDFIVKTDWDARVLIVRDALRKE